MTVVKVTCPPDEASEECGLNAGSSLGVKARCDNARYNVHGNLFSILALFIHLRTLNDVVDRSLVVHFLHTAL